MAYEDVFTALADPTRRHIFESLRDEPRAVGQLAETQTVSRPAVSQHLKVLELAGLVNAEQLGNRRFYSIRRSGLDELQRYLNNFWSQALSAYAAEISRQVNEAEENE